MRDSLVNLIYDSNLLIAIGVSIFAGLFSFFSPCVLPLVPGYLSYAAGMSDLKNKSRVALGSLLFIFGFSINYCLDVFVLNLSIYVSMFVYTYILL